jgi:hypothetical protein
MREIVLVANMGGTGAFDLLQFAKVLFRIDAQPPRNCTAM